MRTVQDDCQFVCITQVKFIIISLFNIKSASCLIIFEKKKLENMVKVNLQKIGGLLQNPQRRRV